MEFSGILVEMNPSFVDSKKLKKPFKSLNEPNIVCDTQVKNSEFMS